MSINVFSIVPVEVFMDDRLTKTDLRVLGAILSWRDKTTNLCWPKRELIATRCNLPLCKISTATTRLVSLGWLKKEGNGGRSRSAQYILLIPTLTAKTLTESVTKTVTGSVRGIKQTNEQTIEQTNIEHADQSGLAPPPKKRKQTTDEILIEFGIDGQLAEDFKTHRKLKRANITTTSMKGFQRESGMAGISLSEALVISIERDWRGFKADWINNSKAAASSQSRGISRDEWNSTDF
ncbi:MULTISPECIES: helix-turn-helix domain-containing protein [Methylobacter]